MPPACGSGMRLGEALGLDWPDLHLDDGYVDIRVSKTVKRAALISEDAVSALSYEAERRGHSKALAGPAFLGPRKGQRLRGDTAYHAWQKLLAEKGLPPMRLHALRHGVGTLMITAGVDMRLVQEQLGHASIQMTADTYGHLFPRGDDGAELAAAEKAFLG